MEDLFGIRIYFRKPGDMPGMILRSRSRDVKKCVDVMHNS